MKSSQLMGLLSVSFLCVVLLAVAEERNDFDIIACRINSRLRGRPLESESVIEATNESERIVVIGDIHGCLHGFLEVLYHAGLLVAKDICEWNSATVENTMLVQIGDIVDRGNNTLGVYRCLEHLQDTAPASCRLIRLIGNHEIWWLTGSYHNRNKDTDSEDSLREVVQGLKDGLRSGKILGSYATRVQGMPILFSHAGFRPEMINFVQQEYKSSNGGLQAEHLSEYVNNVVKKMTSEESCGHIKKLGEVGKGWTHCKYDHELFEAGPDRGGQNIGGPYWTDYSVMEKLGLGNLNRNTESEAEDIIKTMVQVVGHTISPRRMIRNTKYMEAIGVDSGMYIGGRTFLEIDKHGRFLAHEKSTSSLQSGIGTGTGWNIRDLTKELCGT